MAYVTYLEMAVMRWYDTCYLPKLGEELTPPHWAARNLADRAREIKIRERLRGIGKYVSQ